MNDYLVRASALQGIRALVEELGGDADALFYRSGLLEPSVDQDSWISYRSFLLLLEEAARVTACPHFGLLLSKTQDIGILGTLGFVMQQAPDLRTALRQLSKYFSHHNQGAIISLRVEEDVASWRFTCKLDGYAPTKQQSDLVAGLSVNIMRLVGDPKWSPHAVYFPHAAPVDIKPYKSRFTCPLFFDWECMIVAFDAALLDNPIQEANPQLHQVLEEHLKTLQQSYGNDYCGQVRHLIRQSLSTGDCSIEKVADFLAINKRTLQRKLKSHDTNYKDLLEEVRFDIARRYLSESNGSVSTLADMLCYSELSVFSNAFRQHFGISPREWKNQHSAK